MTRPRRPQEWMQLTNQLAGLPPIVAERVKSVLRNWLTNKINQVGQVFFALGLMLRDTLCANQAQALDQPEEQQAQRLISHAQEQLLDYLERNHRWGHHVHLQLVVQECLRQAVRLDELDVAQFQQEDDERNRAELEDVGLMFRTNQLVRSSLPTDPLARSCHIRLLIEAVRELMGTEARHLRRLGVCLHGLQMLGQQGPITDQVGQVDEWLPELVDSIHLLAGADDTTEGSCTWDESIVSLRRWLAEDRLSTLDFVHDPAARSSDSHSTATTEAAPEEQDMSALMQRGTPPWHSRGDSSSGPRRRRENDRERSRSRRARMAQERSDQRSNSHRPWRSSSYMSAHNRTSPPTSVPTFPSASAARTPRGRNPSLVDLPSGRADLGVHAWHVLLDMVGAMDPPDNIIYGVTPTQATNVRASIEGMSPTERCYLLCSFIQVLSLLAADVATITEQILETEEVNHTHGGHAERDDSDLMQRFLVRPDKTMPTASSSSANEEGPLHSLFSTAGEMEIRALVSALELGSWTTSRARALALLQRVRLRFGVFTESRSTLPQLVQLFESALVTFLPDGDMTDNDAYQKLGPQDQDFVDYWWGLVHRQVQKESHPEPSAGGLKRKAHDYIDEEDLELAAEEMQLMKELDQLGHPNHDSVVAKEFQRFDDSQEQEVQVVQSQRSAARFRDWELWTFEEELRRPADRVRAGHVRVQLQGEVRGEHRQTTSWTMTSSSELILRLRVEERSNDQCSVGVQAYDPPVRCPPCLPCRSTDGL